MASPQVLAPVIAKLIGTSATALYTVPAGKVFIIKRVSVYNVDASLPHTITFQTSASNSKFQTTIVNPSSSLTIPEAEGHAFAAGELIQAITDLASVVYISRISGLLVDA